MSFFDFLGSLIPSLKKNDLNEDIRVTRMELSEKVIPLFDNASTYFNTNSFSSKEVQALDSDFMNQIKMGSSSKNMVSAISKLLPKVLVNLEFLDSQVESLISGNVQTANITYKKASLLRGISYIGFVSVYALELLSYIYANEVASVGGSDYSEIDIPKKKLEKIKTNITNFAKILKVYSMDDKKFAESFGAIPDVQLDKNFKDAYSALKEKELDPLDVVLTKNFTGSPIYSFRLIWAEWQANRYKLNKERKKYLELRLMQLKALKDGGSDPALDKQISHMEERIQKLDYELHKQEESVR